MKGIEFGQVTDVIILAEKDNNVHNNVYFHSPHTVHAITYNFLELNIKASVKTWRFLSSIVVK